MTSKAIEWPSTSIPDPIKNLISHFFTLVDEMSDDVGTKLSEEIFTQDGQWVHPRRTYSGAAEIAASPATNGANRMGQTYRRHEVIKVYVCNDAVDDIMILGNLIRGMEDGRKLESPFCGRVILDDSSSASPRFKFFQGITDHLPMHQLLNGK